jgi:hypothetical protein
MAEMGDLCHPGMVRVADDHRARARQIAAELARIARTGMVLPGSLTERRTRCGYPGCSCHADPPRRHGPYWQWTRKVAAKTVGHWLSAEQHHDYQAWIDNDRRPHELVSQLEALGAAALDADPRTRHYPRNQADPAE